MIIIASYSNVSVTYTADGTQTVFSFPFDYLRKAFVYVEVNEETILTQGTDYSVSGKTVVFATAPASGTALRIYRSTDTTPLVSWADASVLRAKDMTLQQVQDLHILEEQDYWTRYNAMLRNGDTWDARGFQIKSVADPTDATDAVNKEYLEAEAIVKDSNDTYWVGQGLPIKNIGEPTTNSDAATKEYVDKAIIGEVEAEYYFNAQGINTIDPGASHYMGECNIIKIADKIIMIDCAGSNKTIHTRSWLASLGVTKIDYLIISHYHGDHVRGLFAMDYLNWSDCVAYLPTVPQYELNDNSSPSISELHTQTINFLTEHGATLKYAEEGETFSITDNFSISLYNVGTEAYREVHDCQTEYIAKDPSSFSYKYNDYSMVAVVKHGNVSLVYSGDIQVAGQTRLKNKKFYQNVDVYKHHHHGYEKFYDEGYMQTVNPKIDIVQTPENLLTEKFINTDIQSWIDKIILLPTDYQVCLTSDSFALEIKEGSEVYQNRDLYKLSLAPHVSDILSGSNLNDFLMGTYTFAAGDILTSCLNAPSDYTYGNGRLICFYNGQTNSGVGKDGSVLQMILSHNYAGIVYFRRRLSGGSWGNWVRMSNADDLGNYMPLSGGELTGSLIKSNIIAHAASDTENINLYGGNGYDKGASLVLMGQNNPSHPGEFWLKAEDSINNITLKGTPTGGLTWGNNAIALAEDVLALSGGTVTGNLTVNGTITGNVTGNADTATNATNDENGNNIATTYLPIDAATTVATTGLTVDPAYGSINEVNIAKYGKICVLEASLKITTAPTGTFATLDAAYKPATPVFVAVKIGGATSNGAVNLLINRSGDIKPYLSTMTTTNYFVFTTVYLLP